MVGEFGEFELKVLFSTLCVSGASILTMASGAAWERGRGRDWARVGMGFSIAGFALMMFGVWIEAGSWGFWKLALILVTIGCAGAHGALLLLAQLSPQRIAVQLVTLGSSAALALLILSLLILEEESEGAMRLLGVLAILATTGSVLTAVFARLERREPSSEPAAVRCPHCAGELSAAFVAQAAKRAG